VSAENPISGETTHTNSAYLVFVALDDEDRPCPVPPLLVETPEEERRLREAKARQEHRLAQRRGD
jgi:acyl-CoA hydrolase